MAAPRRTNPTPATDVIYAWPIPSDHSSTIYEVLLHQDGKLSCPCPDWIWPKSAERRALAKEGIRYCKHTKRKESDANQVLALFKAGKPLPPRPMVGRSVAITQTIVATGVTRLISAEDEDE